MTQMNESSTVNQSVDDYGDATEWLSIPARLWLLLPFVPLSLLCSLFLLAHLLGTRALREPINNHAIILVLILGFVYVSSNVTGAVTFYRLGGVVWPQLPAYCSLWLFVDYGVYNSITVLLAWASFERHILVFHHWFVNTRRKKIIVHYVPLLVLMIYMSIFYITVMFFYPCTNDWDYNSDVCGDYGCYHESYLLAYWELYSHGMIPVILIVFFNVTLLLRVICHKRTVHQPIRWKKYRKMAIQLLCVSALYLTVNFPLFCLSTGHLIGIDAIDQLWEILYYCTDHVVMFLPFVCLGCLPELWRKLKWIRDPRGWIMMRSRTRQIAPAVVQR